MKISRKNKDKQNLLALGLWAVTAVLCAAAVILYLRGKHDAKAYEALQEEVAEAVIEEPEEEPEEEEEEEEEPEEEVETAPIPIDFETLWETCPDAYAWITIPDTNINYPIVQSSYDDTFYLDHAADGSPLRDGAIYTEMRNAKDFTDPNTVIYGHNMASGAMFQNLHLFEDPWFFENHPEFEIYLPEKTLYFRVFAAYTYDDRHILMTYDDFRDILVFAKYLTEIQGYRAMGANLDGSVVLDPECRIVTLSTCTSNSAYRYLVQAVLVAEKPKAEGAEDFSTEELSEETI